ncbi:MAG TPA: cell division protein ZapA [Chitinophagaceae bacterium]|nr:cell division protein ZapA [Chitinophagaceae bacterium]
MENEKSIPANISVADRTYRLKIKPSEEEAVRRTMKAVNRKITEFKTTFAGKDMQDYISMCLIWYATQKDGSTEAPEEISSLLDEMGRQMDQIMEETKE